MLAAHEGVGLIKIDVEGAELDVLKGGAALIARSRPLLYVENDRVERYTGIDRMVVGHWLRLMVAHAAVI